ncbi:MAG: hypothetical protein SGJ01_15215, partial [Gemmatimonadota bacterium]|nr:hypothetical protein [Gemmatimonadota bacterium]
TARSDVYALGCVTYEMLVGEPPFTGPTAQAIVARVMTETPRALTTQRRSVPPQVEDAVLTALEKLPADRFATAAEFAAALNDRTVGRPQRANRLAVQPPSRRLIFTAIALALLTLSAAFGIGQRMGRSALPSVPPSRLAIVAPTLGGSGASALSRQLAITPAGDAVVFVGQSNQSNISLFLQRLDATTPVEIMGSIGMTGPAITPDGRGLIGVTPTATLRLPFEGGVPRAVALSATIANSTFGPDGSYWFSEGNATGIARLTPGDSVIPLPRTKVQGLRVQQVLDERTVLVVKAPSGTSNGPGMLLDLRSGALTPLLDGPVVEMRAVGGELLCVLPDGSLTAAPFDTRRHRVLGPAVQIATGVALTGTGIAQFAVASNGTIAYIPETPRSLVLLDRTGTAQTAIAEQLNLHAPKFSPDGRRLSLDITSAEGRDVWVFALDQRALSRATFDHDGHDATWTLDGQRIIYLSFKSGVAGIYRTRPGATAPAESLLASNQITYSGTWLRDGSALITDGNDVGGETSGDIIRIANGGRGPIEPLVASQYLEGYGAPSPDGRWLAFISDKSGRQEVYVQPLAGEGDQVQISQDGATELVWGPDSHELFFRTIRGGQVQLAVAALRTSPALGVASQRILFPMPDMVGSASHANFDISPDGRTFAMVKRSPGSRIIVIQNLPGLLRRLRGAGTGMP